MNRVVNWLLLAVPLALVWMVITAQLNPGGFAVGYGVALGVLLLLRPQVALNPLRLPRQFVGVVIYVLVLFRDIVLSSVDVAVRVLSPDMKLHPGIIAVPTQDPQARETVAAFSAHNITITPGELVVEFDDNHTLFVHCLDVHAASDHAEANQRRRLLLINRMLRGSEGA